MKRHKILVITAVAFFISGLLIMINWFPRAGWETTSAKFIGIVDGGGYLVTFSTENGTVTSKLPNINQTKFERRQGRPVNIQYNPNDTSQVKMAPESKNIFATIAFLAIAGAIYRQAILEKRRSSKAKH